MKRRHFLGSAAAGIAATALAKPALAQAAPEVKWRLPQSFPKSLDILYGAAEHFAKIVLEMTDGKFQIQPFGPGEIVPALQIVDAVQNGTVEIGHTVSYYYIGKDPAFTLGTNMPFGLNTRGQNAWWYYGGGKEIMNELYAKFNMVGFPSGNTGAQMGGWFRKEIKTVDDLKGLKMRIAGIAGQVMSKLGVVPQQLAPGDLYAALERGTIDAVEWVGPYDDEKLGFVKVAPFYYAPGWWEGSALAHFFVNKQKFEELPPKYRAAIEYASEATLLHMTTRYDHGNPQALKRLVGAGAQVRFFTPDMMDAAFKATEELFAELSAKNELFKRGYDSMRAYRSDAYVWSQVADGNFDRYMATLQQRRMI